MTRRPAVAALALAALAAAAAAPVATPAGTPEAVSVQARPGAGDRVAATLGRSGLRIVRRRGDRLQVIASPGLARAVRRLPGVAAAGPAPAAFGDQVPGTVQSQGVLRTGARALAPAGRGGRGLVIAVLDLGFGSGLEGLRARGELPPAAATETRSFDTVDGLAGRNAYGNPTNHGELVAQTVYDYAPEARYILVNYRTADDFLAAVDWLAERRPDIVVHANSFIEGPFDGTGPAARAVDRAAARGVLWFNSAGNYARRHWTGPWRDPDADGALDFDVPDGGVFYMGAGRPITFAASWADPPGGRADLDLVLERRSDDGASWVPVAASRDRQSEGAVPAERIVGYLHPQDGFFRARLVRVAGPAPVRVTIFSREVDMALFGGSPARSLPTPGDADGSVTVGAVDWRGDRLEEYSSQGPTVDGRAKPDLVAPTDTSLAGPGGPRLVGGTSNAAPNAAGAAALLLESLRAAGAPSAPADVRAALAAVAVDRGEPGWDPAYGAGRVRVDTAPPTVAARRPAATAPPLRGTVPVTVRVQDPSSVTRLTLGIGGRTLASAATRDTVTARVDTRRLRDGRHLVWAEATDWAGNAGRSSWEVRVDNTGPLTSLLRTTLARPARIASRRPGVRRPVRPRPAFLHLRVRDASGGRLTVRVRIGAGPARTVRIPSSRAVRRIRVGSLRPGRVRVAVTVTDRAGNVRALSRVRVFR